MTFKEQKQEILKRIKEIEGGHKDYNKVSGAKNLSDLLEIIKEDMFWYLRKSVLDADRLVDIFGEETLNEKLIFTKGEHKLNLMGNNAIVTLGEAVVRVDVKSGRYSLLKVRAYDKSKVDIETFTHTDIKAYDVAQLNVSLFRYSQSRVVLFDYSNLTLTTDSNSHVNIVSYDKSETDVKAKGSSSIDIATLDKSKAVLVMNDNAIAVNHRTKNIYIKAEGYEVTFVGKGTEE